MTYEELIEKSFDITCKHLMQLTGEEITVIDCLRQEYMVAIEKLKKADKYKWHDLRKNPEDLPTENGKYLVAIDGENAVFLDIIHFLEGEFAQITIYDKVAWKYIEPFEEVEE